LENSWKSKRSNYIKSFIIEEESLVGFSSYITGFFPAPPKKIRSLSVGNKKNRKIHTAIVYTSFFSQHFGGWDVVWFGCWVRHVGGVT